MAKSKHSVNGRDSHGHHLGIKVYGEQKISKGSIILRQKGTKVSPGNNVGVGRDHTIYSKIDGIVKFRSVIDGKKQVSVYPS